MNADEVINRTVSLIDNGHACTRLGQHEAALASFDKAIQLCRPLSCHSDEVALSLAQALDNKANAFVALGRCDEAQPLFHESLSLQLPIQHLDARGLFITMMNLGRASMLLDEHEEAGKCFEAAVMGLHHHGSQADKALALCNWGDLLFRAGQLANAIDALSKAVELWEEDSAGSDDAHRTDFAYALGSLADALQHAGRYREALAAIQRAVEIHRAISGFTNLRADRAALEEVLQQHDAIQAKLPP